MDIAAKMEKNQPQEMDDSRYLVADNHPLVDSGSTLLISQMQI